MPGDVSRNVPCSFSLYTWEKYQMYEQRIAAASIRRG